MEFRNKIVTAKPKPMTRPTRHSCNLDMSTYLCKTKLFQGSYFNRIPQIWNSLPPTIRSSGSLSSFKTALYKHYKSATNSSFDVNNWQGQIQKFQKGGAGSRILERGGRNWTFQCRFPSFSYKSLTNIPPKGGAAARPAPPLNPRLTAVHGNLIAVNVTQHIASHCHQRVAFSQDWTWTL